MGRDEFVNKALSTGFTNGVWLEELKIECEAGLREYCNPEGCPNHGNNWVCPPGCGSLEECAERIAGFDKGMLLQSITEIDPLFVDYAALNREHNARLQDFLQTYCNRAEILVLTSGGCIFCDTCAFPKPCVKPDLRMNSLSAYGIDVGKLCETAGLDYAFGNDRVYYIALVLMK